MDTFIELYKATHRQDLSLVFWFIFFPTKYSCSKSNRCWNKCVHSLCDCTALLNKMAFLWWMFVIMSKTKQKKQLLFPLKEIPSHNVKCSKQKSTSIHTVIVNKLHWYQSSAVSFSTFFHYLNVYICCDSCCCSFFTSIIPLKMQENNKIPNPIETQKENSFSLKYLYRNPFINEGIIYKKKLQLVNRFLKFNAEFIEEFQMLESRDFLLIDLYYT